MIEVSIMRANKFIATTYGKNATFLEGELYFARLSKNEDYYLMRSEEGYWVKVMSFKEGGYCIWTFKPEGFERKAIIYMRNRKRLNQFASAREYLCGYNCVKSWGYSHRDKELYK